MHARTELSLKLFIPLKINFISKGTHFSDLNEYIKSERNNTWRYMEKKYFIQILFATSKTHGNSGGGREGIKMHYLSKKG